MRASGAIIDTQAPGGFALVGDPNKASSVEVSFPDDCALAHKDLIPTLHELVDLTASIVESFKALGGPAGEPPVEGDIVVGVRLPKVT